MTQRLIIFLLVLTLSATVVAKAPTANKPAVVKTHAVKRVSLHVHKDSSTVQLRHFNQAALEKFKKDPAFNYKDNTDDGEPNILQKIWMWIIYHLFGWMQGAHFDGTWLGVLLTLLKYLLYAGAIALVVFIIIKAFGIDTSALFRRKPKKIEIPYSELVEDINVINFDDELEAALAQNNYRLAVRLLYLRALKQLSDKQLIHWQIDKTNSAYLNELTDPSQKQTFSLITRQFEYVWYGNFNIDKDAFANIGRLFQDFKQQLS